MGIKAPLLLAMALVVISVAGTLSRSAAPIFLNQNADVNYRFWGPRESSPSSRVEVAVDLHLFLAPTRLANASMSTQALPLIHTVALGTER